MTNSKQPTTNNQQPTTNDDWLEIGTIVAPQGLKGELRVYPNTDFPERFEKPGKRWLLRVGETQPQPVELLRGRFVPGKGIYVVRLAGVENCDRAEELRGAKLMVPESDRPQLGKDEYHVLDLLDLEIYNQLTGEFVGVVVDVIPAGNTLLEVKLHNQPETAPLQPEKAPPTRISKIRKVKPKLQKPATILIPFVMEIAPVVDLVNRRIEINPPAGLLELS
ncbi:MAG TPA: ribosome maturation factor RimM [Cyanobacteria bacterium UBA11149]|nr:ribosome maturation factor RimM [Cyanobacteria bacterium UBA11149]HCA97810.1 ribosome maturation factor RimM [Cyanobacteria bacterium UBA9226]